MKFASVRIATDDLHRLVAFYERLGGVHVVHLAEGFAELRFAGATLAVSAQQLVARFSAGAAVAAANRSAILEFEVDDVDAVLARMDGTAEVLQPPTTMPWGNRSLLLRDPDGSPVNVFSRPVA